MRIGFLSQRHLLSALGFSHLCSSLVRLKCQFFLGLQAGKERQAHTTPQMLTACLTPSIRARAPEWPEQFGEETRQAGLLRPAQPTPQPSEAAAWAMWPFLTRQIPHFVCHRRNEGPALIAPNLPSTPHKGPGSPQAPVTKQTLLTDLGLWGSQHLFWLLPYGLAVLLELIEPLLPPGARLHFEQMAAFQEELQVLVIFEACGENRSGNVLRDNSRNDAPRAFPSTGAVRSGEESRAERARNPPHHDHRRGWSLVCFSHWRWRFCAIILRCFTKIKYLLLSKYC